MHYVYYLLSQDTNDLLYVGRSHQPRARQTAFHRRTGVRTVMGVCQKFTQFERACYAELKAIRKHQPPFNKVLVSSPGSFGVHQVVSEETRQKMSKSLKGLAKSAEHRENISKAHKGKVFSEKHKANIRKAKQNMSEETRAKIGASSKGRAWSEASKEKLRNTRRLKNMKGGT